MRIKANAVGTIEPLTEITARERRIKGNRFEDVIALRLAQDFIPARSQGLGGVGGAGCLLERRFTTWNACGKRLVHPRNQFIMTGNIGHLSAVSFDGDRDGDIDQVEVDGQGAHRCCRRCRTQHQN